MKSILSSNDIERLLKAFRHHLINTRGLAARTSESRMFYVREFLRAQRKRRRRYRWPQELTSQDLLGYVLKRSKHDSPQRLQALASALRSFCRFLCLRGRCSSDLAAAIPRIRSSHRSDLPDYLSPQELTELLKSIDTRIPAGTRNYAIILCLARLGLRAGEVAALTLDQIDWQAGQVRLSAVKGRRDRQLPLPKDLGQALVHYLRQRPGRAQSRHLFCSLRDASRLSASAVSMITRRALRQARISTSHPGSHLLRRTLASHLVQRGVSLKAVADLLGHRCLDTTRIYTNVNRPMLLAAARPWPLEVQP